MNRQLDRVTDMGYNEESEKFILAMHENAYKILIIV
jgi:hypothetical protein